MDAHRFRAEEPELFEASAENVEGSQFYSDQVSYKVRFAFGTLICQTASKFPLRWWIMHSTLSRRDQLDEPSGPYSGRMRLSM
jgi:hypothetical protein